MDTDISVRFGLAESTLDQFEIMITGLPDGYSISKEFVEWVENDYMWIKREIPYGARVILTDKEGNIIAWRRFRMDELPLTGNFRGIK